MAKEWEKNLLKNPFFSSNPMKYIWLTKTDKKGTHKTYALDVKKKKKTRTKGKTNRKFTQHQNKWIKKYSVWVCVVVVVENVFCIRWALASNWRHYTKRNQYFFLLILVHSVADFIRNLHFSAFTWVGKYAFVQVLCTYTCGLRNNVNLMLWVWW